MLVKGSDSEPVLLQGVFLRRGEFARDRDGRRREDSVEEKWRNRFSGNMEERITQKLDNADKVSLLGSPVMTSTPRHMETLDRKTVNSRNSRTHMLGRNNSAEGDNNVRMRMEGDTNVRMMVRNNVMEGENNVRNLVISHPGLEPVIRENTVDTPTMYRRQGGTPLAGRREHQHRVLQSPRSDGGQRGQEIYGRIGTRFGNQVLNSPARSDRVTYRRPHLAAQTDNNGSLDLKKNVRRSYDFTQYEPVPSPEYQAGPRAPGLGKRSLTQMEISRKEKLQNPQLNMNRTPQVPMPVRPQPALMEPVSRLTDFGEPTLHIGEEVECSSAVRKGLLWLQRDKLFSRWKERYVIITKDYLQCFKKATSRISEMGAFLFKIRLNEVEETELQDKRGYLTIVLSTVREGKILLRKTEGLRDWFNVLKECTISSKERRSTMQTTREFWSKKQFTDADSIQQWLLARDRIGQQYSYLTPTSTLTGGETGSDVQNQNSPHDRISINRTRPNQDERNMRRDLTQDTHSVFYKIRNEDEKNHWRPTKDIPCSPLSKREHFHPLYNPEALGTLHINQNANIQYREEDSGVDSIITNNSESIGSGSSSASQSKTPFQSSTSIQSKQQKPTLPTRNTPPKQGAPQHKPLRTEVNKGNKKSQPRLHEMSNAEDARNKNRTRGMESQLPSTIV